jgi:hypothetical protein
MIEDFSFRAHHYLNDAKLTRGVSGFGVGI